MFAVIDCEGIQTSREHICIRSMYALTADEKDSISMEFTPCKRFTDIDRKYQKSFLYCQKFIHMLDFSPASPELTCLEASGKVKEFVERNQIKVLLYKGGIIEKRLCNEINVPNYNIEKLSVKKANSHQPSVEVKDYLRQLKTMYNFCEIFDMVID